MHKQQFFNNFSKSVIFLLLVTSSHLQAALSKPASYQISLTQDAHYLNFIKRVLQLTIDGKIVGGVEYTIHPKHLLGTVDVLHILPEYRAKGGYGKALLYNAINDIFFHNAQEVRLTRYPFNLRANDSFAQRDAQLKQWYKKFGFEETSTNQMTLKNAAYFRKLQIITNFTDKGIMFDLNSASLSASN